MRSLLQITITSQPSFIFRQSSSSSNAKNPILTTFSKNRRRQRTRRRRRSGTVAVTAALRGADRNNNTENNSNNNNVIQIEQKQQNDSNLKPLSIDTLQSEALGQLSSSSSTTELTGKKFAGFIAVPSHAQANSRSFIAEYCRNINHALQQQVFFRRNPPSCQFS